MGQNLSAVSPNRSCCRNSYSLPPEQHNHSTLHPQTPSKTPADKPLFTRPTRSTNSAFQAQVVSRHPQPPTPHSRAQPHLHRKITPSLAPASKAVSLATAAVITQFYHKTQRLTTTEQHSPLPPRPSRVTPSPLLQYCTPTHDGAPIIYLPQTPCSSSPLANFSIPAVTDGHATEAPEHTDAYLFSCLVIVLLLVHLKDSKASRSPLKESPHHRANFRKLAVVAFLTSIVFAETSGPQLQPLLLGQFFAKTWSSFWPYVLGRVALGVVERQLNNSTTM